MLYGLLEGLRYNHKMAIEAAIVCALVFLLTCVAGKIIIPILRSKKMNQPINVYVKEHSGKAGTPTMGGICFIIASLAVLLLWIVLERSGIIGRTDDKAILPFALTLLLGVGNALIGFVDDYKKLVKKENEGLTSFQKMILQIIVAAAYLAMMGITNNLPTVLHIPFSNVRVDLGILAYPLYLLVIVGFVNSTNITDGLDGLASSIGSAVSMGLIVLPVLVAGRFLMYQPAMPRYSAVIAASLLGALLGFLVFNHYPAKVFMGDTGSLYIGGIIMGCAIMQGELISVIIMGFVFVFEMLSSLMQTLYYKATHGKRIFKKAPVHHHFQLCNWSEIKIVTVFFVVSVILTALGVFGAII
ncbi:MAG: phospho-N-acetylmuramoyl-pentapeptide-transferase [Ruminococcaceae bacterium]|nr:phospho-N-acetylmuramoyl-pentapeptide-transferase [Oscillospiraceae bacterium]